jgi:hypothetical protein
MGTKEGMAKCRAKKKAPGRPPGAKNKITKDLTTAYMQAFDARGGVKGLLKWADESPDIFYGQISKMLPKDVQTTVQQSVRISWGRDGDAELIPDAHVIAPQLTEGDEE